MGDGEHQNMSMQGMGGYNPAMAVGATSSYEQLILSQQAVGAQGAAAAAMARGGAGMPALPKGAPPGSGKQQQQPPDRFGLLGLLSVIRMQDPDLTTLALGTDLTTLGLNLNSPDNLYKTFGSPWSDAAARAEPEFTLPSCYLSQAPRLTPGSFTKFQEETLFYIFYSMPNDEAQVYAADELANRGWCVLSTRRPVNKGEPDLCGLRCGLASPPNYVV
jgi:CCR4-NOT transcription complex subunit 2